jgi:ATP-dependent Clp protease protease subunit
MLFQRHRLNTLLAERTGQALERIEKDTDRDNYMSAHQAAEYGLIDRVLDGRQAQGMRV